VNRSDIEQSKKGVLEDFNGYNNLLVSFGGIKQGLGVPVFEFFNSISDVPCDKIYLRDFNQLWYQEGVDEKINNSQKLIDYLREVLQNRKYQRVCFLGNSMGAYAALLFGSILNVDQVIAFAPQTYINRFQRFITLDWRWSKQIKRVHNNSDKSKEFFDLKKAIPEKQSITTRMDIYYSTKDRLDKIHAERLKNNELVNLHPIEKGGHAVVKALRDQDELKPIIKGAFA